MSTLRAGLPREPVMIGPYRPVQRIGEGGMGVVHLALDPQGRAVALKVLRDHVCADPEARARLRREVESLRRVRSPHVAEVLAADLDGDRPYFATRFVPGPTLEDHVRAEGPLLVADVVHVGVVLAEALAAIHGARVVHRDLKPANVLLLDGDPVVVDFGIAHLADETRITRGGLVMGTPGYLSPEVVGGWPVTAATDWWGWGSTLAYAASGRSPFGSGPVEVVLDRVRQGRPDLAGVDPRLARVLEAALAPDPTRRPHGHALVAMLRAAGQVPRPASPPTVVLPDGARTRPHPPAPIPAPMALPVTLPAAGRPSPQPPAQPPAQPPGQPLAQPRPQPGTQVRPAIPPTRIDPSVPTRLDVQPAKRVQAPPAQRPAAPPQRSPSPDPVPPIAQPAAPASRPSHRWTSAVLLGVLAALAGIATVAPGAVAIAFVVLAALARTIDRSALGLWRRRTERGPRASDAAVTVLALPWRLLMSTAASLLAVVLPALVAVAAAFITASSVAGGRAVLPSSGPALAAGAAAGVLTAWWGPGGGSLRRGSRQALRGLVPARGVAVALVLLLVAGGVGAAVLRAGGQPPDPAPFHVTVNQLPWWMAF